MDIAEVAQQNKVSIEKVADMYFKLGHRLDLHWFLEQITKQPVANHWQALARASFREELDWQQRSIAAVVLRSYQGIDDTSTMIDKWFADSEQPLARWLNILCEFRASQTHEFAKFSVALRELMLLSLHCEPIK